MRQLIFIHTLTRIGYVNFHAGFTRCTSLARGIRWNFTGRHHHPTAFGRKFTGIVGNGVNHKEGEDSIGLDDGRRWLNLQFDTLQLETHLTLRHNVKERLQRETDDAEIQATLAHLNPIGKNGIVLIDFFGQFHDILIPLLLDLVGFTGIHQPIYLMVHAIDKRCDAVHQRYLGALF